jgi:hypothetical protein
VLEFCETKRQSAAQSKNPSPQAFLLLLLLFFFWVFMDYLCSLLYWFLLVERRAWMNHKNSIPSRDQDFSSHFK